MNELTDLTGWAWFWPIIKALLLLLAGYLLAKAASKSANAFLGKHATQQQSMILKKCIFFGVMLLFFVSALQQLHFKLTVLLGSAGILTAAIGFASKTTISNMICGIFLIIEKSFQAGDTIKVKGITGVVDSIDLLSVKLTTFDHTLVRIPNETILSSELINLTHYRYRRLDILVGVGYGENLDKVKKTLLSLVENNELALQKPEPKVHVIEFADSSVNVRFSVYVNKNNFGKLKDQLHEQIKTTFDKNHIEIPFPQLTVHMEQSK